MKTRFIAIVALTMLTLGKAEAQWATDVSVNNLVSPEGVSNYGYEVQTNKNGTTFVVMQTPRNGKLTMRLQILNRKGVKLLPDSGMVISEEANRTWTTVNKLVTTDADGNAIVGIYDQRSGGSGYTIYKIDEQGNILWHKQLNGGTALPYTAHLSMACSDDGGYVFAYMTYAAESELYLYKSGIYRVGTQGNYDSVPKIYVEKLTSDGEQAWTKTLSHKTRAYAYPTLVGCGNSQTMLVYTYSSNYDVMAMMLEADGSEAWEEPTDVYYDGFDTNKPMQNQLTATKGPDGGALVAWLVKDATNGGYENRMSYIMNDGTYGFSTGDDGTTICHATNSRGLPSMIYDESDGCIYCVFSLYDVSTQTQYGIFAQKLSTDGELLWDSDGLAIQEMQNTYQTSYCSVKAAKGDIAFFYQAKYIGTDDEVASYYVLYGHDGSRLQEAVNFTTSETNRYSLAASELVDGRFFLTNWTMRHAIGDNVQVNSVCMQRIYLDGSTETSTAVASARGTTEQADIFSPDGKRLSQPRRGLNIESGKKYIKR